EHRGPARGHDRRGVHTLARHGIHCLAALRRRNRIGCRRSGSDASGEMMSSQTAPATCVKGRILIVDDELVVRDSLDRWFASEGYRTGAVASGREALNALNDAEYDLALLDIKMPGMDGMELQARLAEAAPDVLVVIMTGYATVETAVQALKRGAWD